MPVGELGKVASVMSSRFTFSINSMIGFRSISSICSMFYKMRWHVTYASCCCLQIFETSSLALVIANGGSVSLNAPWGLVTSHAKSSAGVWSTTISKLIFSTWMFTFDVSCEILIQNKNWQIKLWRIYAWSFAKFANVFSRQSFPLYGIAY